ncbi:MAG: F0F1 ATP synthase subunit delta [Rhodocyclaceae bacterium]|nr:F0F1 ATP synthase subunit delta [Rhodocyclaceae bacterium]
MAEIATLARPYAEAAHRVAKEQHVLESWSTLLGCMANMAIEAAELIGHPNVSDAEIERLFVSACSDMEVEGRNLLRLLIDNDRLMCLPEIVRQFEALKRKDSGVKEATLYSAFPLGESQVNSLQGLLENRFATPLKVSVKVNPELIGGICAVVGDQVLDTSVRGKLDAMRAALNSL